MHRLRIVAKWPQNRRMSWDQGFQPREEIPEVFVKWADARLSAPLSYITWFGSEPDIVYLEGEDGSRIKARYRTKPPNSQSDG